MTTSKSKKEVSKDYEIKVAHSEYIHLTADNWECGGNGLKFYLKDKVIAWFITWDHFQVGTTNYEEAEEEGT